MQLGIECCTSSPQSISFTIEPSDLGCQFSHFDVALAFNPITESLQNSPLLRLLISLGLHAKGLLGQPRYKCLCNVVNLTPELSESLTLDDA